MSNQLVFVLQLKRSDFDGFYTQSENKIVGVYANEDLVSKAIKDAIAKNTDLITCDFKVTIHILIDDN